MKKLVIVAALALAGCVSDQRLAELQANHRSYVCTHQTGVALAANGVIANAEKLFSNPDARAAAVAIARNDLAIIASCADRSD